MDIFHDFLRHFLEVFIDDFAVFSQRKDHIEHLRLTFDKCREANLKLNPAKCFIGMDSGILLEHRVSVQGISVDLDKLTTILALKAPMTVKEVRGFLGMVGYYRRFVEGYAKIALPLTELLKKDITFHWSPRQQKAFEEMKIRMTKLPVMAAPRFDREFHVTGDASGFCIGIILWQYGNEKEERPIYYASRQMSPAERNYTTTERECLPIIYACKNFRHYLLGYDVVFHTDHDAIKYLVNKPDLSRRIARWVMLLQEFQYQIKVKPGSGNKNVDYLSRLEEGEMVQSIKADFPDENLFSIQTAEPKISPETVSGSFPKKPNDGKIPEKKARKPKPLPRPIEEEYEEIRKYLHEGIVPPGDPQKRRLFITKAGPYTLIKGLLFRMGPDDRLRRCIDRQQSKKILHTFHTEGGHFNAKATIRKICVAGYWWPTYYKDVHDYIKTCRSCQFQGKPTVRNHWPLTPISALGLFVKWGIDFIGPISPVSAGARNRYIILATDYASKWVEAKATKKADGRTAGQFLYDHILMRFGAPWELESDRGKHFLNEVIRAIVEQHQMRHRLTTPYNPKANGLTEKANGLVVAILKKIIEVHKTDWDRKLQSAVHAYNTKIKQTTGKSPYYLVYGQDPLAIVEWEIPTDRTIENPIIEESLKA